MAAGGKAKLQGIKGRVGEKECSTWKELTLMEVCTLREKGWGERERQREIQKVGRTRESFLFVSVGDKN